ncbi:MAG: hypothetical protein UT23_C0008G0035 [Candidatus Woesebacteria bacterium GW2011_GWA1_39_12]|uniref:IMP dehydrogenase/GMP reductase domain-containing protein n=1 Tax=Candidatus Woesebacteria bacterium GW2011_GWA1_39_12 TaxID=1618549 RepID=A0A0G0M372_9BACT|nr:MAG: hypothetical protein UT23_C0008G0035 [Candidatus Woesebacteria bacterium GW2011_GWA1_39_12]
MNQKIDKHTNLQKTYKKLKLRINELKEPYEEEMQRIRTEELSQNGRIFSNLLENISLKKTSPIYKYKSKFYSRYKRSSESRSIGIVLTNIDLNRIEKYKNGEPVFWQMGKKRTDLALAQRALFFDDNHNETIYRKIEDIETGKIKIPDRLNKRSLTIEEALGIKGLGKTSLYTPAISQLGYKKISSEKIISRRNIVKIGLFNKIGKYPRKIFALNLEERIRLGISVRDLIQKIPISSSWKKKVMRNVGAALGAENPEEETKIAKRLYFEARVTSFRIYTIGSDPRVVKTAKLLRQTLGENIEIFVGQIADKAQAKKLISPDIAVDGLIYGHGGGQQCTSAINGMAITTLEDIYEICLDSDFNKTSLMIEGGVGRSIGTSLIIGVDAVLGNQKFVRGTIETGNIFIRDLAGRTCQPYPGTASPVTQIIESENPELALRRTDAAGRTYYSEGKPGLMYYEEKACSMAFWINEYLRHAARTLADLGVEDIRELRLLLSKDKREFLRIMSEKTQYLSEAHGNNNA